jgi:adenine deaminase
MQKFKAGLVHDTEVEGGAHLVYDAEIEGTLQDEVAGLLCKVVAEVVKAELAVGDVCHVGCVRGTPLCTLHSLQAGIADAPCVASLANLVRKSSQLQREVAAPPG